MLLMVPAAWAASGVVPGRATAPIVVDGRLDEADWAGAGVVDGLRMIEPKEGDPSPPTTFRFLVDDDAVYVGVEAEKGDGALFAPITARDGLLFHDWVQVAFDTWQDGRRAFVFRVNARGVQEDGVYVEGDSGLWMQDTAWDGVFRSAGTLRDDGYTVEFAVPLRSLRYPAATSQTWNVLCVRFVPNPWSVHAWPPLTHDANGTLQQAGTLGPFDARGSLLRLELLPTVTGSLQQRPRGWIPGADPGGGIKLGIGPAVTIDTAINPDFSQIEADDFEVTANLKTPLYLEEKRPFFLEGADLFDFGLPIFYSRAVVDPLGALKATGRSGTVSVGALSAFDESPSASTIGVDYATGERRPGWGAGTVRDARAVTSLARTRWDPGDGLGAGLLFGDKELVRPSGELLGHRVGGVDADVPLGDQLTASAAALWSTTDLPGGGVLNGPAWQAVFERDGNLWTGKVGTEGIGKGFRAETGFLEEVDRYGIGGESTWRLTDKGPFRFVVPGVEAGAAWAGDGALAGGAVGPKVDMLFANDAYVELSADATHERFEGREFLGWWAEGFGAIDPLPTVFLWLGWEVGPQPHYDAETAADLFHGFQWGGETGATVTVAGRISSDTVLVAETFRRSAFGEDVYTTLLPSETVSIHLTRELSVRWRAQWDTFDGVVQNSGLLGWQRDYGTVAFLGYDEVYDGAMGEAVERSLFAKVGILLRP